MSYDAAPAGSSVVRGDDAGKTHSPNLTCDREDLLGGFDVEGWQVGWRRRAHDLCLSQGQWYQGGPAQLGATTAQSFGESAARCQRWGNQCSSRRRRSSQGCRQQDGGTEALASTRVDAFFQPSSSTSRQSR